MKYTKDALRRAMRLYAVTDRAWTGAQTLYQQVESALKGGVTCIQLREKHLDDDAFTAEALEIKKLCRQYKVPLIINDNVEVAIRCGADGVHVGQQDMAAADVRSKVGPDMIIGVSAHNVEEALEAVKNGADCLGTGAAFSTSTKNDASVISKETMRAITRAVDVPVVAIGGITRENILQLIGTRVDGVALVSAIFSAPDIEAECRELRKLSEQMVMDDYRKHFNATNNFPRENGMQITLLRDGYAESEFTPQLEHRNVNDSVHGGVVFALQDFTTAAASKTGGKATVTLNANISYIRPALIDGSKLTCVAEAVHSGKKTAVYNSRMYNEAGQLVSTGSFTYFVLDKVLVY